MAGRLVGAEVVAITIATAEAIRMSTTTGVVVGLDLIRIPSLSMIVVTMTAENVLGVAECAVASGVSVEYAALVEELDEKKYRHKMLLEIEQRLTQFWTSELPRQMIHRSALVLASFVCGSASLLCSLFFSPGRVRIFNTP